jgi:hypothetical protein
MMLVFRISSSSCHSFTAETPTTGVRVMMRARSRMMKQIFLLKPKGARWGM